MKRIAAEGPNADQIEYWNEASGTRWVEMNEILDAQLAPLGEVALERASVSSGERVLDVGCGCGQTSLQLGERVGESGRVVGADISSVMLDYARDRAKESGLSNVEFRNADAQTGSFSEGFDLIFSRFGVMFFASPEDAFSNLFEALRPGGRLRLLTWQALGENPWMLVPMAAAAKHLTPSGPPPDPTAPGPFSFADTTRVEGILASAGFQEIGFESVKRDLLLGGGQSLDDTVRFVLQLGPAGAALRDATDEVRGKVITEVRAALEPFHEGSGVRMQASTWVVSARRAV